MLLSLLFFLPQASFIEGKGFSGYIFDEKENVYITFENQFKRYTPSREDIFLCEKIIKEQLENINNERHSQGGNCPIIHKKIRKYVRQYIGFINNKGEKEVWVNFLWKDDDYFNRLDKEVIHVSDGCSYYWSVQINLDAKNLHHLRINGHG